MTSPRRPLAVFHLDAGPSVGYGHLSRCLTLAEAVALDVSPIFCPTSDDAEARRRVKAAGYEWILSPDSIRPALVVFDGYSFSDSEISTRYSGRIPRPIVGAIDDLGHRGLDCDFVVCPGPQCGPDDYRVPPTCQLLLGPRYALIGAAFRRPTNSFAERVRRLFVGFGGSDPVDFTARIVPVLARSTDLRLDVVLGPGYRGNANSASYDNVRYHHALAPADLASLMADCDAAIAAPGTMSLELAALAKPALLFAISTTQIAAGQALDRIGLCRFGGTVVDLGQTDMEARIHAFLGESEQRRAMREASLRLSPADGAQVVAHTIRKLLLERAT